MLSSYHANQTDEMTQVRFNNIMFILYLLRYATNLECWNRITKVVNLSRPSILRLFSISNVDPIMSKEKPIIDLSENF